MTSLPKRGDRVRVTEVGGDPTVSLHPRYEVTLACDAHVHHEEWVHFDYVTVFGQKWSGPVKVEILERARTAHVLGYLCKVCSGPCRAAIPNGPHPPPVVSIDAALRAEFARGMRRAVELVEQHLYYCQGWDEFDAAIKEELK